MQKAYNPDKDLQGKQRLRAIALVILAVTCFAGLDTTAKYLVSVEQLPVIQVVWIRFLSQFIVVMFAVGAVSIPRMLQTTRLIQQITRSLMMLSATAFNMWALRYLRLDQTTTILFLAPLTVALLAGPILGEWVGWRRLIAILIGFTGVVVAIRPGFAAFHPAFLLALGCMLSYSGMVLLTRYLVAYDKAETTLFYSMLAGSVIVAPLALMEWEWPSRLSTWLVMLSMGVWAYVGHYIFIVAHRLAPTSVLSPFLYMQLASVIAFGYLIFGDLPDIWTLAGSAIIVMSGIYLLNRERMTGRN
jgi:drug/metabolite transporter (DMT)-like permease